jgi:hypothetical protein
MKHLILLIFFSASLSAFSQADTTQLKFDPRLWGSPEPDENGRTLGMAVYLGNIKPDTLRAICLVTLFPNGIAHARMGFVVITQGKRPVYLDCNKKALKLPQVGWDFREVNTNYNK